MIGNSSGNTSDLCQASESVDSTREQHEQEEAQHSVEEVAEVRDHGELVDEISFVAPPNVGNPLATYPLVIKHGWLEIPELNGRYGGL